LVLATGAPISLLSESGYERYRAAFPDAPAQSELGDDIVATASGSRVLPIASIPALALVGQAQGENGACREVYANRIMEAGGCDAVSVRDCPCQDDQDRFCRAGAAVLLREPVRF